MIRRAGQGETGVWETIVRSHGDAVFRLAFLLLGDPADAEDVAQEVFVRAFRSLDRFDSTRPLRPWLMRITLNQARNRRRSAGRYLAAVERWFRLEGRTTGASNREHDSPVTRDEAAELRRAVARLQSQDQEVIYLRFFLGMGEAETAAALAVPSGTVKSRLSRALSRLRTIIDRDHSTLREALKA
ncbi:MAG TPA: RNA polymerase sigma factor [Anaerolineales bacterium]|nr:RNA polymerase sigma factor [Anaerolineales bacterium]